MKWFRFYSEALHDPKVRRLSDRLFRYWVNLLCLASMHERRGILPPLADVADGLRVPIKRAELGLAELVTLGFLDQTADGLMPHNWTGRQFDSDARLSEGRQRADDARHKDGAQWANPPPSRRNVAAVSPPSRRNVGVTEAEQNRTEAEGPAAAAAALYEQCIGALNPHTADLLTDAEATYGLECVTHCLKEAAEMNKRSWRYVEAILHRHAVEGCLSPQKLGVAAQDEHTAWAQRRYETGKARKRRSA